MLNVERLHRRTARNRLLAQCNSMFQLLSIICSNFQVDLCKVNAIRMNWSNKIYNFLWFAAEKWPCNLARLTHRRSKKRFSVVYSFSKIQSRLIQQLVTQVVKRPPFDSSCPPTKFFLVLSHSTGRRSASRRRRHDASRRSAAF